jgi:hypothetical protein
MLPYFRTADYWQVYAEPVAYRDRVLERRAPFPCFRNRPRLG